MTEYAFPSVASELPLLLLLERASSTNTVLSGLGSTAPFATVISTSQTQGRGRLGRSWVSRPGDGLAMSVLVPRDRVGASLCSWVPLVAGVSAVTALRTRGVTAASLKWPNDVLVENQKIAGILCEVTAEGDFVVGVGLNLTFSSEPPVSRAAAISDYIALDEDFPDAWCSLLLRELRENLSVSLPEIQARVSNCMATLGKKIEVEEHDGSRWAGYASGLDAEGRLLVNSIGAGTKVVAAADVTHLHQ